MQKKQTHLGSKWLEIAPTNDHKRLIRSIQHIKYLQIYDLLLTNDRTWSQTP